MNETIKIDENKSVSYWVPIPVADKFKAVVKAEGRSLSFVISEFMKEYVKDAIGRGNPRVLDALEELNG
jgi:hypothetical protein